VRFLSDEWLLEYRGDRLRARHLAGDRSRVIDLGKLAQRDGYLSTIPLSSDGKTLVRYDAGRAIPCRVVIEPDGITLNPTGGSVRVGGTFVTSYDGNLLAVYNGGQGPTRLLEMYDVATGTLKYRLHWRSGGVVNEVSSLCFLPDGKTLAVGSMYGVRLYDLDSHREFGWITTPEVRALALSGDGTRLAAALRYDASLRVWDVAELQQRNRKNP
jgi:hypothetical protein